MKLSIGMMVKNEEKHLRDCLESLEPIREAIDSELVIIDTGSDDKTVEIAKEFTDRVYFHEWNEHFSEMRNRVISYCQGEWLFQIDGDEIVDDPSGLITFFNNDLDQEYNTGAVEQKSFMDSEETTFTSLLVPRLFRLDEDFHYEGAVHNQPINKGPVIDLDLTLLHYGYDSNDPELMESKFERTATILHRELEKDPENIYYWYQLSKSYGMYQKQEESLEYVKQAYQLLQEKDVELENFLYVYQQYVKKLLANNDLEKAKEICNQAIEIKEGYLDFYYLKGQILTGLEEADKAIHNYNIYLSLRDNYFDTPSRTDMAFGDNTLALESVAYSQLARLYYQKEDYHRALKYSLLVEDDRLPMVLSYLIKSYLQLDNYQELKDYYLDYLVAEAEDLKMEFFDKLEEAKLNLEQVNIERLEELFADVDGEYDLLNRIRLKLRNDQIDREEDLINQIKELELNELSYYYGDLIYYYLKLDKSVVELLSTTKESVISQFLGYLSQTRDEIHNLLLEVVKDENRLNSLKVARVIKAVARFLLVQDEIKLDAYRSVFDKYITAGIYYLEQLYSDYVIDNQLGYELDSSEDEFLLKMRLARENRGRNDLLYVRYLKQALSKFPTMKKGIKLIVNDFQNELDKNESKSELKEQIEAAINNQNLDRAEELAVKYEDEFGFDEVICSTKAVISIYQGDLTKAKKILLSGLSDLTVDFNLLYNLGLVYQLSDEKRAAYNVYSKAEEIAENLEEQRDVDSRLKELDVNDQAAVESKVRTYPVNSSFQQLSCTPFFIIGCGRSGTTLLRSILNAHSALSIPPEFIGLADLINKYKKFNYISWDDLLKLSLSVFKSTMYFQWWDISLSKLYDQLNNLESEDKTLAKIIDTIYTQFLKQKFPKAKIWGDKTPLNTLDVELIDEVFPEARYIHLVRNGKDVVSSYLNSTEYVNTTTGACQRWNNHINKALEFKKNKNEENYLEIYYEDLVSNPEQEIEKVCQFIGVEFRAQMLNYHSELSKLADTQGEQHKNLHKPINTDSIGKWKDNLNSEQKERVNRLISENLERLGYIE